MSRAVIFANGQVHDIESIRGLLQEGDFLIAADGGTRHVLSLGLLPALVIGDLDSMDDAEIKKVQEGGGKIIQHPRDKNETDLELALGYAREKGYTHLLIVGALGGRLDQTLGNLALLTGAEVAQVDIRVDDGLEMARFTRRKLEIKGNPGDTVSLIPWGGEVKGVETTGLRWPLKDETLFADKTRGISNELAAEQASVSIRSGLLLVIQRRN